VRCASGDLDIFKFARVAFVSWPGYGPEFLWFETERLILVGASALDRHASSSARQVSLE